jgi:hypothetical protein
MVITLCYIHCNEFTSHPPAMHVNLLCACWYSWAMKGSSSLSFCRLPISLWFTSCLLLCPKLTDAPYSGYGAPPPLPFPKWRLHSQGPHTLPFQGARHLHLQFYSTLTFSSLALSFFALWDRGRVFCFFHFVLFKITLHIPSTYLTKFNTLKNIIHAYLQLLYDALYIENKWYHTVKKKN